MAERKVGPGPEAPSGMNLPRQFTVRVSKFFFALAWIATAMIGAAVPIFLFLVEGWERLLLVPLALLALGVIVCELLRCRNQRLEVDGELVTYTDFRRRTSQFKITDVAEIIGAVSGVLKDREGKVLARINSDMVNTDLFMAYWNAYKQERKE